MCYNIGNLTILKDTKMTTFKLVLVEAKAYFFYAIDEAGVSCKLMFEDKKKGGLLEKTIVEVEAERNDYTHCSGGIEYEFKKLVTEHIPDGRDKITVDVGVYKAGDSFDGTFILSLGKEFIKNGKKVQYAYFK